MMCRVQDPSSTVLKHGMPVSCLASGSGLANGTVCLDDGSYTLRSIGLCDPLSDNMTWSFCGVSDGGALEHLEFTVDDGVCTAVQHLSAPAVCSGSRVPSGIPSGAPSGTPSADPTTTPSHCPSTCPTTIPIIEPTGAPSVLPTLMSSFAPSIIPSVVPLPTSRPSRSDFTRVCVMSATDNCDLVNYNEGDIIQVNIH